VLRLALRLTLLVLCALLPARAWAVALQSDHSIATYTYNALGALKQNGDVALADQRPKLAGGGLADSAVPASVGGRTVTRDAGGNVTVLGDATFAWDRFGHLQSATQARGGDTDTYGFGYDASFRRFEQTKTNAGGTTWEYYAYEGANVVAQLDLTSTTPLHVARSWLYDGVDHPLRMRTVGTANPVVYYEVDLAGNVRRLRAPGGADLGGYRYAAFGKLFAADAKTPAPTVEQPLRWTGRWWNDFGGPDGTYDMRARVWSPELGIFLSADAFAYHDARGTLWSWPNQNPVNLSDPSGHFGQGAVGFLYGVPSAMYPAPLVGAAGDAVVGVGVGLTLSTVALTAALSPIVFGATFVILKNLDNYWHPTVFYGAGPWRPCGDQPVGTSAVPDDDGEVAPEAGGAGAAGGGRPPKATSDRHGRLSNGKYTLDARGMDPHKTGTLSLGKSQWLSDVDAETATMDAAFTADLERLWVNNKAKVRADRYIGVLGNSGELTQWINVYRTKTGFVHGSPGRAP
jgi:RHS repeat-associated protein